MAEGQLKRVQPDLVEKVEKRKGGSFSEKLRGLIEEETGQSNNLLTEEKVEDIVKDCLRNSSIDSRTGEIIVE